MNEQQQAFITEHRELCKKHGLQFRAGFEIIEYKEEATAEVVEEVITEVSEPEVVDAEIVEIEQ